MQLAAIKNAVEAFVAANKDQLRRRQVQYLAKHGRYWQGPQTPTPPPDDGAEIAPDLAAKVLRSSWGHVLKGADAWPALWPAAFRVDSAVGPAGPSYSLTATITKNAKTHTRVWGFQGAPDTGWVLMPDPIAPPVENPEEDLP